MSRWSDAERSFHEDVQDRKLLARAARGRVNGSKSKKCTLPSDYLTPAQRKKLNGEVKIYKMNVPMSYSDFKKLPVEHQHTYLQGLVDKYGVGYTRIAKMFGITAAPLRQYVSKYLPRIKTPAVGTRLTPEQVSSWEAFCSQGQLLVASDPIIKIKEDPSAITVNSGPNIFATEERISIVPFVTEVNIEFQLSGELQLEQVFHKLRDLLGNTVHGSLKIAFSRDHSA